MAFPTSVNNQITDAVTQSNVKVVGEAPAMAIGSLYQTMAHSTGILFENAIALQKWQITLAQTTATTGILQIMQVNPIATAAMQAIPGGRRT